MNLILQNWPIAKLSDSDNFAIGQFVSLADLGCLKKPRSAKLPEMIIIRFLFINDALYIFIVRKRWFESAFNLK